MSAYDPSPEAGPGPETKKRKRNRAALSCANCKSAKIKCSKTSPCEACLRKNIACIWPSKEFIPPPQVFQLETTADAVREHFEARIVHLEQLLGVKSNVNSALIDKEAKQKAYSARNEDQAVEGVSQAAGSPPDVDVESAAISLEALAGGDSGPILHTKPMAKIGTSSPADFAMASLLVQDEGDGIEHNPRLPFLVNRTRAAVTEQIISYLSDRSQCDLLLQTYFDTIGMVAAHINQRCFRREYDIYWSLVAQGHRNIDPTWLSLLCIILAIVLQIQESLQGHVLRHDDLYQLARCSLELIDWRKNPSYRVVQTLYSCVFYMNSGHSLSTGKIFLQEAQRACMAMGLHQLGDDPQVFPPPDRSCPPGSLLAREQACRMWWELVAVDWMSLSLGNLPYIQPDTFTTALPRNFTDEDLELGDWDMQPRPASEVTPSLTQKARAQTAIFVRKTHELPPLPSNPADLKLHYAKVLDLEKEYVQQTETFLQGRLNHAGDKHARWREVMTISSRAIRLCRLWRPWLIRGYADPYYSRAARTSIECARTILQQLQFVGELGMPTPILWFLMRHVLSAITTLLIDQIHDIDTDVPLAVSEAKLVDLPRAAALFQKAENQHIQSARETGRRGRLLLLALRDSTESRRKARQAPGSGIQEDYSQVLKNIASSVKQSASASDVSPTAVTSLSTTPSSTVTNWLDDAETRKFLESLGLLEGQWQPMSSESLWDPAFATDLTSNLELFDAPLLA